MVLIVRQLLPGPVLAHRKLTTLASSLDYATKGATQKTATGSPKVTKKTIGKKSSGYGLSSVSKKATEDDADLEAMFPASAASSPKKATTKAKRPVAPGAKGSIKKQGPSSVSLPALNRKVASRLVCAQLPIIAWLLVTCFTSSHGLCVQRGNRERLRPPARR